MKGDYRNCAVYLKKECRDTETMLSVKEEIYYGRKDEFHQYSETIFYSCYTFKWFRTEINHFEWCSSAFVFENYCAYCLSEAEIWEVCIIWLLTDNYYLQITAPNLCLWRDVSSLYW